jgi:hypothetical protein
MLKTSGSLVVHVFRQSDSLEAGILRIAEVKTLSFVLIKLLCLVELDRNHADQGVRLIDK